eukprot:806853-Prymnesium_polylepis.1
MTICERGVRVTHLRLWWVVLVVWVVCFRRGGVGLFAGVGGSAGDAFDAGGISGEARCLSKLGLGCGYASTAERERVRGV